MAGFLDEVKASFLTEEETSNLKKRFEKELEKLISFWAKRTVDDIKKAILEQAGQGKGESTAFGKKIKGSVTLYSIELNGDCLKADNSQEMKEIVSKMAEHDLLRKYYPELEFELSRLDSSLYPKSMKYDCSGINIRLAHIKFQENKTREVRGFLGIKRTESYQISRNAWVSVGYVDKLIQEIIKQAKQEGIKVWGCASDGSWEKNSFQIRSIQSYSGARIQGWSSYSTDLHYEIFV